MNDASLCTKCGMRFEDNKVYGYACQRWPNCGPMVAVRLGVRRAAYLGKDGRLKEAPDRPAVQPVTGEPVTLTYTNWRRETAQRTIVPQRVWFGSTDWHPEPQWLLTALDTEKGADRDFALKDFGKPAVQPDAAALMDALKDAHDALVSARAFILQKYGSTNPARENAIRKARALLPTEGQQP